MERLREALRIAGIRLEPTPFEQAKRAMKEAGGRELIRRVAKELREQGDKSAIVVEEKKPSKNSTTSKLTLRYDLQKTESTDPTGWQSKEVSVVASNEGEVFIELSFFPKEIDSRPTRLDMVADVVVRVSRQIIGKYIPSIQLKNMSLEEQLRCAINIATHIPDFRYEDREGSLKQKLVKSKSLKRIF